jgi:hypothetical protein
MRSARPDTRRRLAPLAMLLSAQLAGCAASEKATYVSHLTESIHPGGPANAQLAAAFGLDEPGAPGAPALAGADTAEAWDQ